MTFLRALYAIRFGAHAISAEDVGRGECSGSAWFANRLAVA